MPVRLVHDLGVMIMFLPASSARPGREGLKLCLEGRGGLAFPAAGGAEPGAEGLAVCGVSRGRPL